MDAIDLESYRRQWRSRLTAGDVDPGIVAVSDEAPPRFPDVCPACLAPATERLRVERAFALNGGDDDDSTSRVVVSHRIPFCHACAARHRAERAAPDPWLPVKRVLKGNGSGIAGMIVASIGVYFLYRALVELSWVPALIALLPLSVGGVLLRQTWKANHYLAVAAPTSITASVDWTADLTHAFEPPWRAFRFTSTGYAEHFRAINAARLWNPRGPEAGQARRKRERRDRRHAALGTALVIALLIWWLYDEVVRPLLGWLRGG
jgi:hypothetical protein